MTEISTVTFRDQEHQDEACAIVRVESGGVLLCLSRRSGGDIEVGVSVQECARLITALQQAVAVASY